MQFFPTVGNYISHKLLGQGGFGQVYQATDIRTREQVALKFCEAIQKKKSVSEQELIIYGQLFRTPHINLIQLVEVLQTTTQLVLVTELCDMSLTELLKNGPLEESVALAYLRQIVNGIQGLHSKNIAHRDIKPSNILIKRVPNQPDIIKLTDFGLSKQFKQNQLFDTVVGTRQYQAPEIARGQLYCGQKADMYSLGVTLHEMLYGSRPVEQQAQLVFSQIGELNFNYPIQVSSKMRQLITGMTKISPESRITWAQLHNELLQVDLQQSVHDLATISMNLVFYIRMEMSSLKLFDQGFLAIQQLKFPKTINVYAPCFMILKVAKIKRQDFLRMLPQSEIGLKQEIQEQLDIWQYQFQHELEANKKINYQQSDMRDRILPELNDQCTPSTISNFQLILIDFYRKVKQYQVSQPLQLLLLNLIQYETIMVDQLRNGPEVNLTQAQLSEQIAQLEESLP